MVVLRSIVLISTLAGAGAAGAHVSLQPAQAAAGSYQVLRFGVGHGCAGQPTSGLRIEIPETVTVARPQPKSGWTLSITQAIGRETPGSITWTGGLPADQFDEFLLLVKLPGGEGTVSFPAIQSCGALETRWVEPPGGPAQAGSHPAPSLILTPAAAHAGHDHQP